MHMDQAHGNIEVHDPKPTLESATIAHFSWATLSASKKTPVSSRQRAAIHA